MIAMLYAVVVYVAFVAVFVYAVCFTDGVLLERTVDVGAPSSLGSALAFDVGWFILFGLQHSLMARAWFKRRWTRVVPAVVERSTFVLVSTLFLALLLWQWRPIPVVIWEVPWPAARALLVVLSFAGWALLFASSFLLDHLEMFGLRQPLAGLRGSAPRPIAFRTPGFYRYVRHPIYLGFLVGFWAAPTMTAGHAILALGMTSYVLVGMRFEEADLVRTFGDAYRDYQRRVSALLPVRRSRSRDDVA